MDPSQRPPGDVTIVAHEIHRRGGQERVTAELVEDLLARGWRVTVIARRCDLAPHERLRILGVPGPRRPALAGYLWFAIAGGIVTARSRRGVLHVNGIVVPNRADVATVHFCHRAFEGVKRAHGFRRSSRRTRLFRLNEVLASAVFRFAERALYRPGRRRELVAVSAGLATELEAHFPGMRGAISAIPNGVDPLAFRPDADTRSAVRRELGLTATQLVALFVGGDWERKGLRQAIEALADAPDWQLVVVGPGDFDAYAAIAASLGVDDRVIFAGPSGHVDRFYAAADAFVLPTAYETSCLVAIEAAAAGVPIVVTSVNGFPQQLRNGVDGFVVARDAGSIASSLNDLREPQRRAAVAGAAHQLAKTATWDAAADAYASLYAGLDAAA